MQTRDAANYATAGFTFAGTMLVLGGAGYLLDRVAGTQPWLLLLGLVVGAVGGFIHLVLQFSPRPSSTRSEASTSEREASAGEGPARDRRSNEE
jgi:F0F1-type ATP synthase assembly protein I